MPDPTSPDLRRAGIPSAPPIPSVPRIEHVARDLRPRGRTRPAPGRYMPSVETASEISNAMLRFDTVMDTLRTELADAKVREWSMQTAPNVEAAHVDAASAVRQEIEADLARFAAIRADLDQRHAAAAERERVVREAYLPQLAALRDRADALRAKIAVEWDRHAAPLAALMRESADLARDLAVLKGRHHQALVEGTLPFPDIGAPGVHRAAFIPGANASAPALFDGREFITLLNVPPGYRVLKI